MGLIGRGSFGEVYEIERELFGDVEKAALKVIAIPQHIILNSSKDTCGINEILYWKIWNCSKIWDGVSRVIQHILYILQLFPRYSIMGFKRPLVRIQ